MNKEDLLKLALYQAASMITSAKHNLGVLRDTDMGGYGRDMDDVLLNLFRTAKEYEYPEYPIEALDC